MISTRNRISIGRIGPHELSLDPIGFGIFALLVISWGGDDFGFGVTMLVAGFFAILVHELGHAVTIRHLTGQATLIVMTLGGLTMSRGLKKASHQFLISVAGPMAGFLLGALCLAVLLAVEPGKGPAEAWRLVAGESRFLSVLKLILIFSVVWGILNLIPANPLDGGQAFRALLEVFGMEVGRARRVSRVVAIGIATVGGGYMAIRTGDMWLAFIAVWIIMVNVSEARQERDVTGPPE